MTRFPVQGAGLGLRRALLDPLHSRENLPVDFMEVAPENWMHVGGALGNKFRQFTEQFDFVCHGLSLSIGSPSPLDMTFLKALKAFLDEHNIKAYSEHLSYCSDDGHLYDLMPIPFTEESAHYVAERIRIVQDVLEQRIAMENVSYYAAPGKEMDEIDFLNMVLDEANCDLLLDVNNIYVNSINHGYDAESFLASIPCERISYIHVAGHFDEAEDLLVDTHGAPVKANVWDLLALCYQQYGVIPTLLERDFNIPSVDELLSEVGLIHQLQNRTLAEQRLSQAGINA
ncbi:MAG: hypothetical protein CMF25_02135 [Kangiellaceae bacterium]|nr:hypothetical protein [Kangiellaceae bacterium]|tara:strand:+ start:238 stop:1095 length:858 start_codon:yes stop_codon:yes gene_type:complete